MALDVSTLVSDISYIDNVTLTTSSGWGHEPKYDVAINPAEHPWFVFMDLLFN